MDLMSQVSQATDIILPQYLYCLRNKRREWGWLEFGGGGIVITLNGSDESQIPVCSWK